MIRKYLIRSWGCLLACSILFMANLKAQCPGGLPYLQSIRDTVVNGQGYNEYLLPQFDPSIGTLYSVSIQATITFVYNYTVTNTGNSSSTYTVRLLSRNDDIEAYSTAVPDVENIFHGDTSASSPAIGVHHLAPGETVSRSVTIYNNRVFNVSVSNNVVPFLGDDTLRLRYLTSTFGNASGAGNKIFEENISEDLNMSVTYNYCPAAVLPSSLISLTASKQSGKILLSWTSQGNLTEGSYELLKSFDGKSYSSANKQSISRQHLGSYNFIYKPAAQDPGKAFFRIRQTDKNGNITYSKVITVAIPKTTNEVTSPELLEKEILLYPTVTQNNIINIHIPRGNNRDEWQVRVVSQSGQTLQLHKFSNSNQSQLILQGDLRPGMYVVDLFNKRTQKSYKEKIMIIK